MPRVTGLGHVGIYVRDLERMVAFYRDVLGMQITKQNWRARRGVPERRPRGRRPRDRPHARPARRGDPHLIQQISMRVAEPRRPARLPPPPGGRGLPHRGRRQPRERHRLLLLRSRGQPHRGVLGHRAGRAGCRPRIPSTSSSPTRSCWPRWTACGSSCATCRWAGGWPNETADPRSIGRTVRLAARLAKESVNGDDADSIVGPSCSGTAAAMATLLPLPAFAQGKPVKIGLLTVKTGPLAAGRHPDGAGASPASSRTATTRWPAARPSWWSATPAATRPAPRPRRRSWSSATTST